MRSKQENVFESPADQQYIIYKLVVHIDRKLENESAGCVLSTRNTLMTFRIDATFCIFYAKFPNKYLRDIKYCAEYKIRVSNPEEIVVQVGCSRARRRIEI